MVGGREGKEHQAEIVEDSHIEDHEGHQVDGEWRGGAGHPAADDVLSQQQRVWHAGYECKCEQRQGS